MQVRDKNKNRRSFGTLALVCAVVQLALAPNIALGNGRANIALVFAALIALTVGGRAGVLAGFFGGLFFDFSTTGPIGLMALLLTIMSYVLRTEERNRLADEPSASFGLFAVASLVVIFFYHMAMLLVGLSDSFIDAVVFRTLPTFFLTCVAFGIFEYALTRGFSSPSGGFSSRTGWGGLSGHKRRGSGSHYSLGKL